MAEQSIFHNIVRRETAYTQLLCDLLKKDQKNFRAAFLKKCGVGTIEVKYWQIRAEERLVDGYGRADISIDSPNLRMIIEVKTEVRRGKQPSQELNIGDTYLGLLCRQASTKSKARLIFLVPPEWVHRKDVETKIAKLKNRLKSKGVSVDILDWCQILPILTGNSLLDEFGLLIRKRFGPICFTEEEKNLMFNGEFPISEMVKLVKLVAGLREKLNAKRLDIQNEEFGFYLEKKGDKKCSLYVGCGPDVSTDYSNPLYFGVGPGVSDKARKAFAASLKRNYSQKAVPDGEWLFGRIPRKDFDEVNALGKIEPKLKAIWDEIQRA